MTKVHPVDELDQEPERWISGAQLRLAGLLFLLMNAGFVFQGVIAGSLSQSAVLFIGLPAVIAIGIALLPPAKSITGMVFRGLTIAILMSGILFREGIICVIMASPLLYSIGISIAVTADHNRRRGGNRLSVIAFVPIALLLSMEGVLFDAPNAGAGRATIVTTASPAAITTALERDPDFTKPLSPFLALGFPRPTQSRGTGLEIGALRQVSFDQGQLLLRVAASEPGHVRFAVIENTTAIAKWAQWQDADVRWAPSTDGRTTVTWTLAFRRLLSPAWYFQPLENRGFDEAAAYLATVFDPADGQGRHHPAESQGRGDPGGGSTHG